MPYPISYDASRYLKQEVSYVHFSKDFFDALTQEMQRGGLTLVEEQPDSWSFSGPIFRYVWNGWHYLNGITSVKMSIQEDLRGVRIQWTLRFWEALALALLFSVIPFLFLQSNYSPGLLLIIWGLLFTGNYLFSYIRFNRKIKRLVRRIADRTPDDGALG